MKSNKEAGFTLIELLVVTAITSLLSSIAVTGYSDYKAKAYSSNSMVALRAGIADMETYIMEEDYVKGIFGSATRKPGPGPDGGSADSHLQIHSDWDSLATSINLSMDTSAYMRVYHTSQPMRDQYLVAVHNLHASSRHTFFKSEDGRQGFFTIQKPPGQYYEENANDTPGYWD